MQSICIQITCCNSLSLQGLDDPWGPLTTVNYPDTSAADAYAYDVEADTGVGSYKENMNANIGNASSDFKNTKKKEVDVNHA